MNDMVNNSIFIIQLNFVVRQFQYERAGTTDEETCAFFQHSSGSRSSMSPTTLSRRECIHLQGAVEAVRSRHDGSECEAQITHCVGNNTLSYYPLLKRSRKLVDILSANGKSPTASNAIRIVSRRSLGDRRMRFRDPQEGSRLLIYPQNLDAAPHRALYCYFVLMQ